MGKRDKTLSFLSLFSSPDKPKTGVAQVARGTSYVQVRPPRAMRLVNPFTASMNSLVSSHAEVSVDEFADTDSSGHSREEIVEAETIYSIISGYEENDQRESNAVFMEDFSGHSHDQSGSGGPSGSSSGNTGSAEAVRPKSEDILEKNTTFDSTRDSGSYHPSVSSNELLGNLRSVEIGSGSNADSSKARSSGSSNSRAGSRSSFMSRGSFGVKSRDSRGITNLTAGVDSSSGLPVTLYTVQDAEHKPNRWSLFGGNKAPKRDVPPVPGEKDSSSNGSDRAASSPQKLERVHYGSFSGISGDHPHYSVATVSTRVLGSKGDESSHHSVFGDENRHENSSGFYSAPVLPQSSKTRDSEERRNLHNHMYEDSDDLIHNADLEKGNPFVQIDEAKIAQPWSKWLFLMVMGLVAVPIYFMLAFGFFDNGGHRKHFSRGSFGPPANGRYFACYTYLQKLLSFVLGLVWMALVYAAIAIAFGLRARFH